MLFAFCSGLVILLIFRGTDEDSVMQTEGPVTLLEGKPLTLNCTYQTSYSAIVFWYFQYQNKELKLLLKSSSGNQGTGHTGFQANLMKSERTFHLQKTSVQTSDSAVYYCALEDTELQAAGAAEHKPQGCCRSWMGAALSSGLFSLSSFLCWRPPQSAPEPRNLQFSDYSKEESGKGVV
ncbi:hypothetical protein MC885_002119 [Smutsia gigantea]|nr:hypothetical protein MC885_002119 [Smutsia gigantea]